MKILLFAVVFLALNHSLTSQADLSIDHSVFDAMCQKYIDNQGNIDYKSWLYEKEDLEDYLEYLAKNLPESELNQNDKLAYWINLYNAATVKLILNSYPIESIRELHKGNPWDVKWIRVGDDLVSLNEIEHDVIRKKFNEPRIHFAVNCAARSCPPIKNSAWMGGSLEADLELVTSRFINNKDMNHLSSDEVKLSKIFEWYEKDFGNVIDFINKYSSYEISKNMQIDYLDYNWDLNSK